MEGSVRRWKGSQGEEVGGTSEEVEGDSVRRWEGRGVGEGGRKVRVRRWEGSQSEEVGGTREVGGGGQN